MLPNIHNEHPLFGRPYVLWNSRPAKNGQPPPCYGQCNINIGTRKVGAAMKRLPNIFMGPKSKDQILQKWDPVSRTIVNVRPPRSDPAVELPPPGDPDRPCGSRFPDTTFFVLYTNDYTFIREDTVIFDPMEPDELIPFTLFPNDSDAVIEYPESGIQGITNVPTDSVTTRQLLINFLNNYFQTLPGIPRITASLETHLTLGTPNVLTLRVDNDLDVESAGIYFGQGSRGAYTLGIVAPYAGTGDPPVLSYYGLMIRRDERVVQARFPIVCD